MKKYLVCFFLLNTTFLVLSGQHDFLMKKCILSVGPSSKIIKDFNIQMGEKHSSCEFRYKENLSLRKRTKYRFTMCTADNSKGQLILELRDQENKTVLSSYDQNTGTIYSNVDFVCNKNGIYQICFDFTDGQSGSGVSIVSMIQ
jgi:hypothetical protein